MFLLIIFRVLLFEKKTACILLQIITSIAFYLYLIDFMYKMICWSFAVRKKLSCVRSGEICKGDPASLFQAQQHRQFYQAVKYV